MKNFNNPPREEDDSIVQASTETSEKLAQSQGKIAELGGITQERSELERLIGLIARGKSIAEKSLESHEFKLLAEKKSGDKEAFDRDFATYTILVGEYEKKYGVYTNQLDLDTGIEDYAKELHDHL